MFKWFVLVLQFIKKNQSITNKYDSIKKKTGDKIEKKIFFTNYLVFRQIYS